MANRQLLHEAIFNKVTVDQGYIACIGCASKSCVLSVIVDIEKAIVLHLDIAESSVCMSK